MKELGWTTIAIAILVIAALCLALFLVAVIGRWHRRRSRLNADRLAHEMMRRPRVMPTIYDRYDHDVELYDHEDRKRRHE